MIGALREQTLALLAAWTPIASVAGDPAGLAAMAEAVTAYLRDALGAEIISVPREGDAPLVHARIDQGAARSLLLYNMYDVMPAAAAGWSAPPFRGCVLDLPGLGPCFVGRGSENNKGPLAGMLVALGALLARGGLAANVEILIEGEEESGSAALRRYLGAPDARVRRCDAALFPSFCEYGGLAPRVYLGAKGIAHGVIRAAGPGRAVHSSNAPWIGNPAWALLAALAGSAGPGGDLGRVALPEDARPLLNALAAGFDAAAELRLRQSRDFSIAGDDAARLETVLTAASLNLASLRTDPPGGRAVIPRAAEARFDLRLPPGMDPTAVLARLRTALGDAELEVEDVYPGHRFAAADPAVAALTGCYRAAGASPQIWPWALGAMPSHAFARVAPGLLVGGLGHGGNAHGADEFVTLAGLDRFLDFVMAWLPATVRAFDSDITGAPT